MCAPRLGQPGWAFVLCTHTPASPVPDATPPGDEPGVVPVTFTHPNAHRTPLVFPCDSPEGFGGRGAGELCRLVLKTGDRQVVRTAAPLSSEPYVSAAVEFSRWYVCGPGPTSLLPCASVLAPQYTYLFSTGRSGTRLFTDDLDSAHHQGTHHQHRDSLLTAAGRGD